ncbi:acyl-CoA reductase-like NAD-dependent aldehyde dehydrogenase [Streptomyces sp. V4I23]|uniref:aldehyde dehydrogenase family protein n=1 Tax=Streptomyces sp. V4I23 TaxID=3042282 RepID=UPI0027815C8A|nr:aldehyde dehydrogenase [Streptomyces sp. V4I23]MDQ1005637.1 acyl-CoA reductase-like NAD-dependent aldehyde dehydrogenase [Streptomyces sp. V4I23]
MIKSYPLFVAGEDRVGREWVYWLHADYQLEYPEKAQQLLSELPQMRCSSDQLKTVAGRVAVAEVAHVEDALLAAASAKTAWSRVPLKDRARVIGGVFRRITARRDECLDVMVADGFPHRAAEQVIDMLLHAMSPEYVDRCMTMMHQEMHHGSKHLLLLRRPDGVVCVNPPRNGAIGLATLVTTHMLAAGNTLVVKAPYSAPVGTMHFLREIVLPALAELNPPPGTLNLICGDSQMIRETWLDSPQVDDIVFFGGDVGLRFGQECVRRGKKPLLELAGNDGVLVWQDAHLVRASEALTECFLASAQGCFVPKYAIVHPAVAAGVLDRVVALARELQPSLPSNPGAALSPVGKFNEFFEVLNEATAKGAQILVGGKAVDLQGQESKHGPFIQPTVVRIEGLDTARKLRCVNEETYFPLLPIIIPETKKADILLEEVIDFMNDNAYGIRNSVWTDDEDVIRRVVDRVTSGGLLKINDSHVSTAPLLPVLGGTGRSGGPWGEASYPMLWATHLQGVSIGGPIASSGLHGND